MNVTRQRAMIRLALVAVLTAILGITSMSLAVAGEETGSVPVAGDDSYEFYGFMGKQKLPALDNDVASEGGGALSYYEVSKTSSQYQATSVKITNTGQMQVSIAPFDSGNTVSWTYRVQDETGQVSEPATVQLYVKPYEEMKAKRTDHGRRATFKNRNEFDVQIRLDWSSEYSGKKADKIFVVPASSEKSVRMHKRNVRYVAKALPWKKSFFIDYI